MARNRFVGGIEGATALVMGLDHSCAVVDGSLLCWGFVAGEERHEPRKIEGLEDVVAGAGGFRHTCVTTKKGEVQCFGDNDFGQLGVGAVADVVDAGIENAKKIAVGGVMVCAIVGEEGKLACRGNENWEEKKSKKIEDVRNVVAIAAGQTEACAVDAEGKTTCFDNKGDTFEPTPGQFVTAVSADADKFCTLTKKRDLFCWQGRETEGKKSPLGKVSKIAVITAAGGHRCMADTRGRTFCFGSNDFGQMGTGRPGKDEGIAFPKGLGVVKELDSGSSYTCARNKKNEVFCWGHRLHPNEKPTQIEIEAPVQIATADDFGCATTEAGEVLCWGNNEAGQLGDGSQSASDTPIKVQGLERRAIQVSAGFDSACALLDDGKVTCWGSSPLGDGPGTVATVKL